MTISLKDFTSYFELLAAFYFVYPTLKPVRNTFREIYYKQLNNKINLTITSISESQSFFFSSFPLHSNSFRSTVRGLEELLKPYKGRVFADFVLKITSLIRFRRLKQIRVFRKSLYKLHLLEEEFNLKLAQIEEKYGRKTQQKDFKHEIDPIFIYSGLFCVLCLILAGFYSSSWTDEHMKMVFNARLNTFLANCMFISLIGIIIYLIRFYSSKEENSMINRINIIQILGVFILSQLISWSILVLNLGFFFTPSDNYLVVLCLVFPILPILLFYGKPMFFGIEFSIRIINVQLPFYFFFFPRSTKMIKFRRSIKNRAHKQAQALDDILNPIE